MGHSNFRLEWYGTDDENTKKKWDELRLFLELNPCFINNMQSIIELDFFKYFLNDLSEFNLTSEAKLCRARIGIHTKKDELGAPPKHLASPGRLNLAGTRYLYLADSVDTAIRETRACEGVKITTAEFRVMGKIGLRLVDFHASKPKKGNDSANLVNRQFSLPNDFGKPEEYKVTQCITEFLRSKGYDGVRYDSSLRPGGINYAIFDPEKMEIYNFKKTCVEYVVRQVK